MLTDVKRDFKRFAVSNIINSKFASNRYQQSVKGKGQLNDLKLKKNIYHVTSMLNADWFYRQKHGIVEGLISENCEAYFLLRLAYYEQ